MFAAIVYVDADELARAQRRQVFEKAGLKIIEAASCTEGRNTNPPIRSRATRRALRLLAVEAELQAGGGELGTAARPRFRLGWWNA